MPVLNTIQPSFAAGELSPYLYGRVDFSKFHVGCRRMLNWFVHSSGGASNRPGTKYIGAVDDQTKRHRLFPFQFRSLPSGQTYMLVFGDLTMQVAMNNGTAIGFVQLGTVSITGATQANPCVITAVAHGFVTGTRVPISGVVGMTQLNGNTYTITRINADTFSIGVDSSAYTAYVSGGTAGGGNVTIVTPYAYTDLPTLKFVQSADTMTLTHPSYAPRSLTRTGHAAWALTTITFAPSTSAPTGLASGAPGAAPTLVVTAINDSSGEESLPSASASGTGGTDSWTWTAVAGCTNYNVYKKKGSIFGFVAQVQTNAWTDASIDPDISNTPPGSRNPFPSSTNYPGCTTFFLQRQAYADTTTMPQTLWFSNVGAFYNMNVSIPTKDSDAITRTLTGRQVNEIRHLVPVGTSMMVMTSGAEWRCWPGPNSSALTPAACYTVPQTAHGCSHVPPIQSGNDLLFWQEKGSRLRALRFDAIQDQYQSFDMSVLASHMLYDTAGAYQVEEAALAAEPFQIIWMVRSDGALLGFTYMREHDVYAWHRHTTDGIVESVATITEPDGSGGYEDAVYLLVKRTINGSTKRYLERMVSRIFSTIANAWFVDCGLVYDGWNTDAAKTLKISGASYAAGASVTLTAGGHTPFTNPGSIGKYYTLRSGSDSVVVLITAYTSTSVVTGTIASAAPSSLQNTTTTDWALMTSAVSGLDHLEAKTVAILGDGSVVPSATVSSGAVTLDAAYAKVIAGLPYTADMITLNFDVPGAPTVQGSVKKMAQVTLRVKDTRGLKVGIETESPQGSAGGSPVLQEVKQRALENLGTAMSIYSGDWQTQIPTEWNKGGRLFARQEYPLPATILALIPETTVGT